MTAMTFASSGALLFVGCAGAADGADTGEMNGGTGGSIDGAGSGGAPAASGGGSATGGGSAAGGGTASGGSTALTLEAPDNAASLLPWLEARTYAGWRAEPEYHASSGPHGDGVKVFYSPLALESVDASEPILRPGGAIVKELTYANSDSSIYGWSVYVRGTTAEGAASYYFYEIIKPSTVYGDAYGSTECTGCHSDDALLLSDPELVAN